MRAVLYFTKRYLFTKGNFNVVNVISLVSVFGISIITMSTIIVMSIFNGLDDTIKSMYNSFDSSIKIEPLKGKTFYLSDDDLNKISNVEGVLSFTKVIENTVIISHDNQRAHATIKGVDSSYLSMTNLESLYFDGNLTLGDSQSYKGLLGYGLAHRLGWHLNTSGFTIFAPDRNSTSKTEKALNSKRLFIAGVFSVTPDYDEKFLIAPISFTKELFAYDNGEITALELNIKDGYTESVVKESLLSSLNHSFKVSTRYQKNELLYQSSKNEKIIATIMAYFILFLAGFTLLAAISMLVIDKEKEILTLKSLGASNQMISSIFFYTGFIINMIGVFTGVILGVVIVYIQDSFGIVKLSGMITDHYPVKLNYSDVLFVMIFSTVLGLIASKIPVKYLVKKHL